MVYKKLTDKLATDENGHAMRTTASTTCYVLSDLTLRKTRICNLRRHQEFFLDDAAAEQAQVARIESAMSYERDWEELEAQPC